MRVVAGVARGAKLKAPAGMRTRPMADKIKEALFSVLMSLGVEPQRVLDLYAGSGAVGSKALSLPPRAPTLSSSAPTPARSSQNLAHTKFDPIGAVHQTTVESFLARTRGSRRLRDYGPPLCRSADQRRPRTARPLCPRCAGHDYSLGPLAARDSAARAARLAARICASAATAIPASRSMR